MYTAELDASTLMEDLCCARSRRVWNIGRLLSTFPSNLWAKGRYIRLRAFDSQEKCVLVDERPENGFLCCSRDLWSLP